MPELSLPVRISLLRPDDLLNLEISAVNLRLVVADAAEEAAEHKAGPVLVVDDPAKAALLIVRFPPQTIVEEAFFETDPNAPQQILDPGQTHPALPTGPRPPTEPGDLQFRLGEETRLVFTVPPEARIPYTMSGLLDWSTFELVVSPIAAVEFNAEPTADALTIRAPHEAETTLQLPFRLHLSPTKAATWQHKSDAVMHAGRAELWHTRLAALSADGTPAQIDDEHTIGLRAIWSPDYVPGGPVPAPGESGMTGAIAAMDTADRHQIVVLTSAFEGYAETVFKKFIPEPIRASMVMLSSLGGWLRSFGKWNPPAKIIPLSRPHVIAFDDLVDLRVRQVRPELLADQPVQPADRGPVPAALDFAVVPVKDAIDPGIFGLNWYDINEDSRLDLSQWAHIAAQGRDHYVRLVYEGKLSDTGNRASLVKVTERRFELSPSGDPVAYLRQYMYVVVREPEKVYANEGLAHDGRAMPFTRIKLTTLVTPHIDFPYTGSPAITDRSFWVMVGGQDFLFHGITEDADGNISDFAKPLIFVPNSETKFADIQKVITTVAGRTRLQALVPGQKIALVRKAPPNGAEPAKDNASFVTESFMLGNEGATRDTFFKPTLFKADIRIPAVEALTGTSATTSVRLAQQFIDKGLGHADNMTDAFAEVAKVTEVLAPDGVTKIAALSPTGSNAAFSAAQAGGFSTPNLDVTVLTRAAGPLGGELTDALSNTFKPSDVFAGGLAKLFGVFDLADLLPVGNADGQAPKMQIHRDGDAIVTELDWQTDVGSKDVGLVTFTSTDTTLTVHAVITKKPGGKADSTILNGALTSFAIKFLESLIINFTAFTFESRTGSKTDVNVTLNDTTPVEFVGDLSFVEGLRQLIPPGVFGDGVSIDLIQNPLGIKAGLAISLPPATVGVFALKNIAFSAGLTIPFLDGKPVVEFGFARRDAQFLLAVMIFGGGGFFHVELDTDGMRMLEAAFEFGATAALDIGVASGEVHIMAGIYFKMETKQIGGGSKMVASLSGYLRCGGSLCVLGIVRISVEFYLSFTYYAAPEDKAKGRATLTVEVEIACFSKSIELTVERAFGGEGGDPTFADQMETPALWAQYADAFA